MEYAKELKEQIMLVLGELVADQKLAEVQADAFNVNPFTRDFSGYPVAIVTPPLVAQSIEEENITHRRTYSFTILVIEKSENITSDTRVEELMDSILNAFDLKSTLNGKAIAGLRPTISPSVSVTSDDKTFTVIPIEVRAETLVTVST